MVKAGSKTVGEVVSANMVFVKAGTQTPTVSLCPESLLMFYCRIS